MPEVKTITVTASNYNTEITDVIRGKSGVTAHPQVTMEETLANACWFDDELHNTVSGNPSPIPGKPDSGI